MSQPDLELGKPRVRNRSNVITTTSVINSAMDSVLTAKTGAVVANFAAYALPVSHGLLPDNTPRLIAHVNLSNLLKDEACLSVTPKDCDRFA